MGLDLTKRYWLFAWSRFYPEGGLHDLQATSDDYSYLRENAKHIEYDEAEILDTEDKTRHLVNTKWGGKL